jgi:hypothetical protein
MKDPMHDDFNPNLGLDSLYPKKIVSSATFFTAAPEQFELPSKTKSFSPCAFQRLMTTYVTEQKTSTCQLEFTSIYCGEL